MALYGIKDCANLQLFDKATGKPVLFADYANVSTNEWDSDRVYATSKGTSAIAWDSNRRGTLQVEMEVFDLQWLAIVLGSDIKKRETQVSKREVIHVGADKKATLSGSPIKGSVAVVPVGADEIEHIGEPLTAVTVDGTTVTSVGTGQFSVDGSELTFASDAIEGTPYAVYYIVQESDAKTFTISSDKFPKAFKIVADAMIREKETGTDQFVQIVYENARPQSKASITMSSTEATKLQITFDLFPNKNKAIAEYIFIDD